MCVRAVRATYLIVHTTKKVRPFLLHIHITLLVARRSRDIKGEYIGDQYGCSVIGRIYGSVTEPYITRPYITQLHLLSSKAWPFWFPL